MHGSSVGGCVVCGVAMCVRSDIISNRNCHAVVIDRARTDGFPTVRRELAKTQPKTHILIGFASVRT